MPKTLEAVEEQFESLTREDLNQILAQQKRVFRFDPDQYSVFVSNVLLFLDIFRRLNEEDLLPLQIRSLVGYVNDSHSNLLSLEEIRQADDSIQEINVRVSILDPDKYLEIAKDSFERQIAKLANWYDYRIFLHYETIVSF